MLFNNIFCLFFVFRIIFMVLAVCLGTIITKKRTSHPTLVSMKYDYRGLQII